MKMYLATFFAVLLGCSMQVWAHGKTHSTKAVSEEVYQTAAGQVVQQFHQALQQGNRDAVLARLAPDVQIFEGAGVERSRDEYKAHHLDADIKYLKQISSKLLEQQIEIIGDIAYAVSRSQQQGEIKDKKINRTSVESLVLRKQNGQWHIVLVHWS